MSTNLTQSARAISLLQIFGLAFGAILGAGWIVGVGQWLAQAGTVGALAGLTGGALIIALVSLCYAEASGLYPSSGGEVTYVERFFGPGAGQGAGWLLVLTYVCAAGFEAISIAWLCEALWADLRLPMAYRFLGTVVGWPALLIAVVAVGVAGAINFRGVKAMGRVQTALSCALVAAALIFVGAAIVRGKFSYLAPHFVRDEGGSVWPGIGAVFVTAPFWFSGFGVVSYSMGDIPADTRFARIALVVILAVVAALAFYVTMLLATALTLPRTQLLKLDLPASTAFTVALGSIWLARLVLLAGVIALFMALNAILFAASRVVSHLSASGLLPLRLAAVHKTYQSPHRAVVLTTLLIGIAALSGRGATASLIDVSAVSISVVYIMICAGVARLRFTAPQLLRPYRIPGGLAIPATATMLTAGMILGAVVPLFNDRSSLIFQSAVLLGWIAIGLACALRRRALEC